MGLWRAGVPSWWSQRLRSALAWRPEASPWLLAAGACLAWLGAGPAVWAATAGALPGPVPFFAVALVVWGAGWLWLAGGLWRTGGHDPHDRVAAHGIASRLPAILGAGAATTAVPAAIAAAGALGGQTWVRDVTFGLAVLVGAAALMVAVESLARLKPPGAGSGAGERTLSAVAVPAARWLLGAPGTLAALAATLAGCGLLWWGTSRVLGLYASVFVGSPFIRAWFDWCAGAVLAAALVQVYARVHLGAPREGSGEEPPVAAPDAAAPSPLVGYISTGAICLLLVVLVSTQRTSLALSHAVAGAPAPPSVSQALNGAAERQAARHQARMAAAAAANREALALAQAGDYTLADQLAAAGVRMDPRSALGYQVKGLTALRQGDGAGVWGAVEALVHVGAAGRGFYLLSQACARQASVKPPVRGARDCQAAAAVRAMLARPALAVVGLAPLPAARNAGSHPPVASLPPSTDLTRAVARWADVIAAPVTGGDEATAARAMARAYALRDMVRAVPLVGPDAQSDVGLALMLAAGGVGDPGAMADGAALLPRSGPLSFPAAEAVLAAGAAYGITAPGHTGYAVPTAIPVPVATRALAAAGRPDAPEALLRLAGEYDLLTANNNTHTNISGEHGAIGFFTRALRKAPKGGALWTGLAVAHYELGQFSAAVASAKRATALGPDATAEAIAADGRLGQAEASGAAPAQRHAYLQSALGHFRRSLDENQTPFLVWMGYGDALLDAGNPSGAIDAYTTAEGWYRYDLVAHVDSFSAPHEGWAMTGMPGKGLGLHALQVAIHTAQQKEKGGASHAS